MKNASGSVKAFCNVLAIQKGLDPGGYAREFEDGLILEVPLPWKKSIYSEPGALPQETFNLREKWLKAYQEGQGYRHLMLMVAPDKEYSVDGYRHLMYYKRQPGAIAAFGKIEYLVPEEQVGGLVWALYEAPGELARYEHYRQHQHDSTRDILVCTHGTVDSACAKFGYPLYNFLRKEHTRDDLRVWRVSHFGGHVFAPTLMDMPIGHYWAYVEEPQAEQIVQRSGGVTALRGHYRGWAGLPDGFLQVAERELWQRFGWEWINYVKTGAILAQDDNEDPLWADVRIEFRSPDGQCGAYQIRVEVRDAIETIHTTGQTGTHKYPQYDVSEITESKPIAAAPSLTW